VSIEHCSSIAKQAIEFASRLSPEIIAIHIEPSEHPQLSLLFFQAGLNSGFNDVSGYNLQPAPAVVEKAKGRCLDAPKEPSAQAVTRLDSFCRGLPGETIAGIS
jgi:hypothetical protein